MTAYVSEQTVDQALKNGAFCCMAKPFDIEKVKALIERLSWQQEKDYFLTESYVI